ncbi:MAG: YhjD/YihY/BrkB family envelope integrity protein [Candidatus Nanopelagicales bacterium]
MDPADPAHRAREEGASRAVVRGVDLVAERFPVAARDVGFWAAVYGRFTRHRASVLAGGLAFFALLSLVPSLLSLGALVALFFDPAEFVADVKTLFADQPDLIAGFAPLLDEIARLSQTSLTSIGLAGVLGVAMSLYAASRFVYVGRQVLDIAFELEPTPPSFLNRGVAIAVTFLAQVLVVVGVLALALLPGLLDRLGVGEFYSRNARLFRLPFLALVVYLVLTATMRFGTKARRVVGWANLGAAVGTLLIVLGSLGLGWYLSTSTTYSQIVAVLGGVIALEIWLYLIGMAIVLSAEIEGIRHGFSRRDRAARRTSVSPLD